MSVEVKELTKEIGGRMILDHLTFSVERPSIFGIIGQNGSGKTTLMRTIIGLMQADAGSIMVDGAPVEKMYHRCGYMPEERGTYMKIQVLDQLVYSGMLRGMKKKDARESALDLLDQVGIQCYAKVLMERVPKEVQQKIQLLQALVHRPKLLLLDEPFRSLDPIGEDTMRTLLKKLVREEECYILIGSQHLDMMEQYCEGILILNHGKNALSGNLRSIKKSYGHTNLVVSCPVDVTDTARDFGMELRERRQGETEYKIDSDDQADALLSHMLSQGFYPTKYEIREPSLTEIFKEKVGGEIET